MGCIEVVTLIVRAFLAPRSIADHTYYFWQCLRCGTGVALYSFRCWKVEPVIQPTGDSLTKGTAMNLNSGTAKGFYLLALAALLALTVSVSAQAQVRVQVGAVSYAGEGCPPGSSQLIRENGKRIFVLSNFSLSVGGNSTESLARTACSISIPVTVPSGYSIAIIKPELIGSYAVEDGAQVNVQLESFFAGSHEPTQNASYSAGQGDIVLDNPSVISSWSPCGTSQNIRFNFSSSAQASDGAAATATVQALEFNQYGGAIVLYRRCQMPRQ